MKAYIKHHPHSAGKWIYRGYKSAWEELGFDTEFYDNLSNIDNEEYIIMAIDADINSSNIKIIEKAKKAFIFANANTFPNPWGHHPNFLCACDINTIQHLNSLENTYLWTFGKVDKFHNKWKNVNTIPLAFDSINYKSLKDGSYKFDVCYIGGWANNGFNEKRKIMIDHFATLKDSGLRCGIFIDKDLTFEQENYILCNSKIALNIHDAYQRILGFDSNERTFKSLGLTGTLVCDNIGQVKNIFPHLELYENPQQMLKMVKEILSKPSSELENIKSENRQIILKDHTYISRVNQFRSFI